MLFHTAHWHRAGGYPDEHDHAHELEAIGKAARASGARRQGTRATSLQTLEGQMAAWCNQHAGECTYQLFMHWGSSVNNKPVTNADAWKDFNQKEAKANINKQKAQDSRKRAKMNK